MGIVSKRISAFLIDALLLCLVAVAIAPLLSGIVGYQKIQDTYQSHREQYYEQYGIKNNISEVEYNQLSNEERARYEAADKAFGADPEVNRLQMLIFNLFIVIVAFSIFFAHLILEFLVPLFLKNGQTLGKHIFALGVIRVDCVKLSTFQLFVRSIIGKYTIEVMVPVMLLVMLVSGVIGIMAPIVIVLFWILQIVLLIVSRTNSLIHDALAVTVVVDMMSQVIYESDAALLEAKKQAAAEQAQNTPY